MRTTDPHLLSTAMVLEQHNEHEPLGTHKDGQHADGW